ncbi:Rne/Rng family ribonuclease [Paracoccus pacificus]|uniref:Ribonuclease E n=1 Tax=Paracoccus pacificus TaxID=1463598 RepID=A0ABW4R9J9_9RHOB
MAKKMLIDATHAEETRVVVADGTKVEEFDFETLNKRQLAGNIYLAKVTRVEPSLQAAFVDYGGNRHGFLAFAEIHPDYYQIPAADRQALLEEELAYAEAQQAEESGRPRRSGGNRRRGSAKAEAAGAQDVVIAAEAGSDDIPGMAVIDPANDHDDAVRPDHDHEHDSGSAGRVVTDVAAADAEIESEAATDLDEPVLDESVASASDRDDEIESIAEEDVSEEIRAPRKPRARRYKIQEVIKVRQIMLVQVVKEERGNKGAALTTYLSLAGRYCVLMPNTARGGGISRKITNAADRKKLKDIAGELEVPQGAGLIIRTAGSQRTRTEIKRDYEYLMRLWEQIRELTFKSIAPAPIYEEGDLIKRSIRDLYSKDIDEVLVEGDAGYRTAKDFMKMIMPSHAKNVKHYTDPMPIFARYQVESYLGGMFNPVVQLKSGGYIVIGVTEALVAIDVNSGRATKEGSIEDTAFKTNCEAADEIARQLRLRDLAGLIVIDFIDMEERKNNAAVEKRFKDRLKTDRARIQVGRISGFGLMEMSRQRLRPGMLESTTQPCAHCHGTGLIRSDDSLALTILRGVEEEGTRKRSREVLVKAPVAVANFLMNVKREHIAGIEARYGMAVRVEADPTLVSPDYALEKFKTATRNVPEIASVPVSVDARLMAQIDEEDGAVEETVELDEEETAAAPERAEARGRDAVREDRDEDGDNGGRKKRRRRRRRRGGGDDRAEHSDEIMTADGASDAQADGDDDDAPVATDAPEVADDSVSAPVAAEAAADAGDEAVKKPRKPRARSRSKKPEVIDGAGAAETIVISASVPEAVTESDVQPETVSAEAEMVDLRDHVVTDTSDRVQAGSGPDEGEDDPAADDAALANGAAADASVGTDPAAATDPATDDESPADQTATEARPKRRGWWSLGR